MAQRSQKNEQVETNEHQRKSREVHDILDEKKYILGTTCTTMLTSDLASYVVPKIHTDYVHVMFMFSTTVHVFK